jgi:hypothetical protein
MKISFHEKYMEVELSGSMEEKLITDATMKILGEAERLNYKRVLYVTEKLEPSTMKIRKVSLGEFKKVAEKMEKLASWLPNRKIYLTAKLMAMVGNIKNFEPFSDKRKAIEWLES